MYCASTSPAALLMMRRPTEEISRPKWGSRMRGVWWQKVRPFWHKAQWPLVWALAGAALALGYVGFEQSYPASAKFGKLDILYRSFQLFLMESGMEAGPSPNWQLQTARWLAPAVTIYTATKAFIVLFSDQLASMRLWFYRRHVVVCGLGRKGYMLSRAFRRLGYRVVVIDTDERNERIDRCREEGVVVLVGDASDRTMLRKARTHRARLLFSVVGDDGANAEAAGQVRRLVKDRASSLTCLVHIVEPQLRDLLSEREFLTTNSENFRLEFFNVYQEGARALLRAHAPFTRSGGADEETHLLVVGLGRMGQGLVTQAAGEWHETEFHMRGPLRITVVDREPEAKIDALRSRHPQVNAVCELIPWQVDVYSPEFQRAVRLFDDAGLCRITAAYVCLDDDAHGLYTGLTLLKRLGDHPVSVIVRMMSGAGLATLLHRDAVEPSGRYSNIHSFNLLDQTCNEHLVPSTKIDTIASAIHADYVRWQEADGEKRETNPTLVPWDELPESLREKNRQLAEQINAKLASIGCDVEPLENGGVEEFTPEEVEQMASLGHERWRDVRSREGWTYHPDQKDVRKKTSPHLVSWPTLQERIRESNRRAVRAIPTALAKAGFQVYRKSGTERDG